MKKTIRRRRKEGKTDYKARLAMIKSEKPRLVIRKSSRYITVQIVQTEIAQDKVIVGTTSKALLKKGWPKELSGSLKSKSAAYLTGLLLGKMAKSVGPLILDLGINRNIQKSRVYAVLKGALDSGLDVSHNPEALMSDEELTTEKTKLIFDKVKEAI